jgi:hypothetical protein
MAWVGENAPESETGLSLRSGGIENPFALKHPTRVRSLMTMILINLLIIQVLIPSAVF